MLRNPNPNRRIIGRVIVVGAVAFALPLTASRAVQYVDVPSPVPATPSAAATPQVVPIAASHETLPAAVEQAPPPQVVDAAVSSAPGRPLRLTAAAAAPQAMPLTQVAAGGVAIAAPAGSLPRASLHDEGDNLTISGDMITIDGVTKRFEDLTPDEKARVRVEVAKARASLRNVHIDGERIASAVAAVPEERRMAQLQRQLARTQASTAENLEAARRSVAAIDWPRVAQGVEDARRSVAAIDWPKVAQSVEDARRAVAAVNWQDVAHAQQSVDKAEAELDRIQARLGRQPEPVTSK